MWYRIFSRLPCNDDKINKYEFDGLRIDTVPEVEKPFWKEIQNEIGIYTVGEVYNGDVGYVAGYQGAALDSVLSYPLFFQLRNVFANKNSAYNLQNVLNEYNQNFKDPSILGTRPLVQNVLIVGTFTGNHDQARWLNTNPDPMLFQNGLTYLFFGEGMCSP